MRDISATNFTHFIHANTFFSCRFSALMRIDYMSNTIIDDAACRHCGGESGGYHPCPYSQEIHDCDDECNCCEECTQEFWVSQMKAAI